MITMEFEVTGRYIIQGKTEDDCREQCENDMSEVFAFFEFKEVK